LYDGQGSTRQLVDNNEDVKDAYSYDGYGVMLGANPASAATSLLYTGEMYDGSASMYYLRARWYDQQTGRFNRMDPFAGNTEDPQSLHKYLYCHANPVNGIDSSGLAGDFSLSGLMANINARMMVFWFNYGGAILNALWAATKVTGLLFVVSNISLLLIDWGYLPENLRQYSEAIRLYSGVGFVLSLAALLLLSTLPDPRQTARPPQPVPRLDRDRAVDGSPAPEPLPRSRPVSQNAAINAEKNRDVLRLQEQNASQIRVDQRQVQFAANGSYVQKGWNRPDCQGIFENKPPVHIEYDTRLEPLIEHRDRILANDPEAMVILKWFDSLGNYTIVP
jgi:RHS repeat-associated protein